jgi:phage terminase small subunit
LDCGAAFIFPAFALYFITDKRCLQKHEVQSVTGEVLNPKQEKFCQLYVQLGNASEAYRQAYNSKAKPESVNVMACNLLSEVNITLRVEEIRESLKANHGITLKNILDELEEARVTALSAETPQSSAAVAASMGKAKLLGFDREKKETPTAKPFVINFVEAKKQDDAN